MEDLTIRPEDAGQICSVLLLMSGYSAMERGSGLIEPLDLIKAIYVVDLEHVSKFWRNWENFEEFIASIKIGNGLKVIHINRFLYLARLYSLMSEEKQVYPLMGRVSPALSEIFSAARKVASARFGYPISPTSSDLLFCLCKQDASLAAALRNSGLDLDALAALVEKS